MLSFSAMYQESSSSLRKKTKPHHLGHHQVYTSGSTTLFRTSTQHYSNTGHCRRSKAIRKKRRKSAWQYPKGMLIVW